MLLADGQQLLRFYIFIVWLFHGASILALLILRYKNKKKKRPYKVDLWIPVVVEVGIAYLLIAPFLQKPEKEFIAAVTLLGLCIISYYPITWLKSYSIISVPDKITIWLQLFLRIAPKRDLRRERKSFMRQMSMLAKNSIILTPNVMPSPALMRRFSRRMSTLQLVQGSPALMRRFGDDQGQTSLRRRIKRGSSFAELDFRQRVRSSSVWTFGAENKASPAIIRKKPNRQSRSFSQADIVQLKSPASLPILKNRYIAMPPEVNEDTNLGATGMSRSVLSLPHQFLRPTPSPIPEEDSSIAKNIDSSAEETKSQISHEEENLQVIADFESDGGGEYEVLAHPEDVRRASYDMVSIPKTSSDSSSSSSDSDSSKSDKTNDLRKSVFTSIFDSSASSSSDSESSVEEEGSVDEHGDGPPLPRFYYSEDEIASDLSDNESGGYINDGFVLSRAEQRELPHKQGQNSVKGQIQGLKRDEPPNSEV